MSADSPYAARPWLRHYDYWVRPHLPYPERPLSEILDTTAIEDQELRQAVEETRLAVRTYDPDQPFYDDDAVPPEGGAE